MINNREYLKQMGIALTGNVNVDNNYLVNKCFKIQSDEPICTYYVENGIEHEVFLTINNHNAAFTEVVWENLTLAERLRVLKWKEEQFLSELGYSGKMPKFEFLSNTPLPEDVSFTAMSKNGRIELVLSYFDSCNGYSALTTILHECIHEKDHQVATEIIRKYVQKYLPINAYINPMYHIEDILKLPLEGKIYNKSTKQFDYVTKEMAVDFLFLKNAVVAINSRIGTQTKKSLVVTKDAFEKYIRKAVYLLTPREKRAFEGSAKLANKIILENTKKYPHTKKDVWQYNKNRSIPLTIMGKKRELQKYYRMDILNIINMELINEYNKLYYQDRKEMYIMKDLMNKREKCIDFFYETSFKGKSIEK
ncbi:MAG: hypothetical protein J6T74_03160 [Clostridia bacterium]|nr:hypothetical protein [Clostridia bacterium]